MKEGGARLGRHLLSNKGGSTISPYKTGEEFRVLGEGVLNGPVELRMVKIYGEKGTSSRDVCLAVKNMSSPSAVASSLKNYCDIRDAGLPVVPTYRATVGNQILMTDLTEKGTYVVESYNNKVISPEAVLTGISDPELMIKQMGAIARTATKCGITFMPDALFFKIPKGESAAVPEISFGDFEHVTKDIGDEVQKRAKVNLKRNYAVVTGAFFKWLERRVNKYQPVSFSTNALRYRCEQAFGVAPLEIVGRSSQGL